MTEYQPRTPERLVGILRAQDVNPRSWQAEAANEIERLRKFVALSAKQELSDEMDEDTHERADFEGGYDRLVLDARSLIEQIT